MPKKRSLRERGSAEERRAEYANTDSLNNPEEQTTDTKKPRTDGDGKRWTLPTVPKLAPLPAPGTDLPSSEDNTDILQQCLGFSSFGTTKGMHVFGNQDGPLPPKRKRRQYRQMLHVKGIYDVPLTRDQIGNDSVSK